VDAAGQVLACGKGDRGVNEGHIHSAPTPVTAMVGICVRSVTAGFHHSLALTWDGRVYSWGANSFGQLGLGDRRSRPSPVLVEKLEGECNIAAAANYSLAVTQSGAVFSWGRALKPGAESSLVPRIVEWLKEVRVRKCVCANTGTAFAVSQEGELFSWGPGDDGLLGHGDEEDQPSPKRVEALRGVRVSSVSVGQWHALALAEDGLVYTWGENRCRATLGNPHVEGELLPKPIEALRGVRVSSVAAGAERSYALANTGELWAWGVYSNGAAPHGHGVQMSRLLPKPIESLRGMKVDAVAASDTQTLALADDGSVFAWGNQDAAKSCALGLGPEVKDAKDPVRTPQCIAALRLACGGL
jgi:alpha-tubulin suppressor-like RCC1 family protein